MTPKRLRWLAVIVAAGTITEAMAGQVRPLGPGEANAAGEALLAAEVARYGRVRNAAWDQDISIILKRIEHAVGYPGMRIDHVVVGDPKQNAAALPGSAILVNAGLLQFLQALSVSGTKAPATQHERFTAFLAAVLSHEVAHITLGHTDSILASLTRLALSAGVPESTLDDPLSYRSAVQDTGVTLEILEHSRERELAADRVGALYLLRAGWTIQTAMDLFRALDSLERKDPSFYQSVTYVRTHPRSSTREAALEEFRARLKVLQADYDDALALIGNNVAVWSAVTLLDTVLVYFPEMLPALHARGTAYHQLWLETVPVPVQQVRASLTTYRFRFLPMIRGVPGDLTMYRYAKEDYTTVLSHEPLALTAVQLALLDAYAGDCTAATRLAKSAATSDSLSASVANNRGVVLLVCGRAPEGLEAFHRAQRLVGAETIPSFLFNTARAMKALGDDARAQKLFRQYLTIDATSEWAAEARRQLGGPVTEPASPEEDVSRGESPPVVHGIKLGDSRNRVRAMWGNPSSVTGDTTKVWSFPSLGTKVAVSPSGGIMMIILVTREAGAIDGVHVSDPVTVARNVWGVPKESKGEFQFFSHGTWGVVTQDRDGIIAALAIVPNE